MLFRARNVFEQTLKCTNKKMYHQKAEDKAQCILWKQEDQSSNP